MRLKASVIVLSVATFFLQSSLPGFAESAAQKAMDQAYAAHDYDGALQDARAWTRQSPSDALAWRSLGAIECTVDDVKAAEAAYRKWAALRPSDPQPYIQMGGCYGTHSLHGTAVNRLVIAAKLAPQSTDVWYRLGIEYQNKAMADLVQKNIGILNQMDQHIADEFASSTYSFKRLLALGGGGYNLNFIWNHIGTNYFRTNDYVNAINAYHKALRLDANDTYSRNGIIASVDAMENGCRRTTTRPGAPGYLVHTTYWTCNSATTAFINTAKHWASGNE